MIELTKTDVLQKMGMECIEDRHDNAAAMASAYAKAQKHGGTVPMPERVDTPGSALARAELAALAARHAQDHAK